MLIPQYWAESLARGSRDGRVIPIRRFGWSEESQADAQENADQRAAEALERVLSGENLDRRERKVPYNGADGVPIREEIVSRHGETVITRNSYGALCLNTPNALFADVDFALGASCSLGCVIILILLAVAVTVGWITSSLPFGIILCFVALAAAWPITSLQHRLFQRMQGGAETAARARVARFAAQHPEWSLRIYRTPAGLRILDTHAPFLPTDAIVQAFFADIGTDPIYVRMCLNQQCFRARVSPKPWRIGIDRHIKSGVWPVHPDRLPVRQEWITAYERAAKDFAACEYVDSIGSGVIHPEIASVVRLHDDFSRGDSGLPIA